MSTAIRLTRGIATTAAIIGLATTSVVLAKPGTLQANLDAAKARTTQQRSGVAMPICDAGNTVITESANTSLLDAALLCSGSSGTPGHSYGRSHDLSGVDSGGNDISLECIKWGFDFTTEPFEATVKIYSDDDGDPSSGLTSIASRTGQVEPGEDFYVTFDAGVIVPASYIFIELVIPSSSLQNSYAVAANGAGQNSPSWLRTEDGSCGVGSWTNLANIGYPNVHYVEEIEIAIATPADPCDEPLAECAPDITGPNGTPDGSITVDDLLKVIGEYGETGDGTYRPACDVAPAPNGDCQVTVDDLLLVIELYGDDCTPTSPSISMNEVRANHSGADTNEYIEIYGEPGASLNGHSWIVIGDGTGDSPEGHIENVISLDGLFLDSNGIYGTVFENTFENSDPVTHVLVRGLTGVELTDENPTFDLDTNDDRVLDLMPWEETIDCVALIGSGTDEFVYCDTTVGPDGPFVAAGGYRCPDGNGPWVIAPFELGCQDSPGLPNPCDPADDPDGDGIPNCADNCVDTFNPDQADCDEDGEGDACDLGLDCNSNNIPDVCETDCNLNGVPDECDINNGTVLDCNSNGIPDDCDPDCNGNGTPDDCDITDGTSIDSDGNGIPDECESPVLVINEIHADPSNANGGIDGDANGDGTGSTQQDEFVEVVNKLGSDVYLGGATLSDGNSVRHTFPNDTPILGDGCAIVVFGGGDPATFTGDFQGAIIQVASTGALGLNNGGDDVTLTAADGTVLATASYGGEGGDNQSLTRNPDVYGTSFAKHSDVSASGALYSPGATADGSSFGGSECGNIEGDDADGDGILDEFDNCDLPNPDQLDCDGNGVGDVCDIADGTASDCDGNGVPDTCDPDCNENGSPDACDIADGTSQDTDGNGVPDECESALSGCYDWADGGTVMGQFGDNVTFENVVDPVTGSGFALKMTEDPLSGTPQGYVGWVTGLTDGDVIDVSMLGLGDGTTTSKMRLWGHYTSTGGDISAYAGSAGGPSGYSESATEWTLLSHQWTFNSDGGARDGLVIEARIYSYADADPSGYVTDISVSVNTTGSGVSISFPGTSCDITPPVDTDGDGVADDVDNCDLFNPEQLDCDGNGVGDVCDLADGTASDCDGNGVPDTCDPDCNENGSPDACDITDGTSQDTNGNGVPDECETGDNNGFFDWSNGATVLGSNGDNVTFENVVDPVTGSGFALKMTEDPLSGTPQGYVGWVTGLTDGDVIDVSMLGLGDGTTTSKMRLWGHYTSVGAGIDDYAGSASGPSNYSESATEWTLLTHQWVFDSNGGARDGLVIEARIYSYSGAEPSGYVTDLTVNAPAGATVSFPSP